jgi:Uma2 family endonuclease
MTSSIVSDMLTLDDWGLLPEDEEGEFVDGHLVEEETATVIHETLVAALIDLLRSWIGAGRGLVGGSNAKFRVSGRRGRKPDLYAYLPGSKLPRGNANVVDLPPDIMIEVVSAARSDQRRDRIEKLTECERFGVRYYWLVDLELRSFEILELGSDGATSTRSRFQRAAWTPSPAAPGQSWTWTRCGPRSIACWPKAHRSDTPRRFHGTLVGFGTFPPFRT